MPISPLEAAAYARLRRAAERSLAHERRRHTLAPTDLAHEAWLRLGAAGADADPGRAARALREVLVDHARRRAAAKRGGGAAAEPLAPGAAAVERDAYVAALDDALRDLDAADPELAAVVELRFFGGLEIAEIAGLLALSPRTVKRRWQLAKAWLHREITGR